MYKKKPTLLGVIAKPEDGVFPAKSEKSMPDSFFSGASLGGEAWNENPAKGLGFTSAFLSASEAGVVRAPNEKLPKADFVLSVAVDLGVPKIVLGETVEVTGVVTGATVAFGVPKIPPENEDDPVTGATTCSLCPLVFGGATASLGGENVNGAFVTAVSVVDEGGRLKENAGFVVVVAMAGADVVAVDGKLKPPGVAAGKPKRLPEEAVDVDPKRLPEDAAEVDPKRLPEDAAEVVPKREGVVVTAVTTAVDGVFGIPNFIGGAATVEVGMLPKENPVLGAAEAEVDEGIPNTGGVPTGVDVIGIPNFIVCAVWADEAGITVPGLGVSQETHLTASALLLM